MAKRKARPKEWTNYQEYLKSDEWGLIRDTVRKRDAACQMCMREDGDTAPQWHVHHFRYPENLRDDTVENCVLLCSLCHGLVHAGKGSKDPIDAAHWLQLALNQSQEYCMADCGANGADYGESLMLSQIRDAFRLAFMWSRADENEVGRWIQFVRFVLYSVQYHIPIKPTEGADDQ